MRLSAEEAALVGTIYSPPLARRPWMLADVLPSGPSRYYSLARWALVDAFRACGVRAGDRVLVPALICREVLASINVAGAIADFYPMSAQLGPGFSPDRLGDAKVIVAVNYFGFPQNLEPFRDYCRRTGAALVEDNAHGLFSREEAGQLLGSRGDAGIFSFRKSIAVPGGGAVILSGDRQLPHDPDSPSESSAGVHYYLKQAFRRIASRLGPVTTLKAIGTIRNLRQWATGDAIPPSPPDAETRIETAPCPPAMIRRPLLVGDPELEVQRRRALYDLTGRVLGAINVGPVFADLPRFVAPYGFPIAAQISRLPEIRRHLAGYGLPVLVWPELPSAGKAVAVTPAEQVMVVPFLW